jgi:hypothetical protein
MTERKKFDFDRLDKYCKENNVILLEDYSEIYLTKNILIKGNCAYNNCINTFEKKFDNLVKAGGYCVTCIKLISNERAKKTLFEKYEGENNKNKIQLDILRKNTIHKINLNKLLCYCKENNLELLEDYSNSYLTKKSCIKVKCNYLNCNKSVEKIFREIEKTGAYCEICKNIIKLEKTKKTCLEKYGVEYSCQNKDVKNKLKNTYLEKYGTEHAFQSEIIKNKIKQTMINTYGVENPMQNNKIKEKTKNTVLKKYGVDSVFKNKIIKEKCKNTILEKYGVENPSQNEEIKLKKKETSLKNWGVDYPSQNEEIKLKKKETSLKNWGVEYPLQNEEVKNKVKETNLNKFGVTCTFQNEEVKLKIKETNLHKLGVEYPSQNDEVKIKIKETNLHKLGVEYPSQNEEIQNKTKQTCIEKYGCEYSLQSEKVKSKTKQTCIKKYGYEHPFQNAEIMEKNVKSSFTKKEYNFPSGRIDKIQGYENFALDELIINEKINESDIITGCKNVPEIWYNDENGKKHRHYVDIFIPSQNKCIEVKSDWTYKKQINSVLLKQNAAKELGYKYEFWMYDKKGNKICYE